MNWNKVYLMIYDISLSSQTKALYDFHPSFTFNIKLVGNNESFCKYFPGLTRVLGLFNNG